MRSFSRILVLNPVLGVGVIATALGQDLRSSDSLLLRPGDAIRLEIQDEPHLSGEFALGPDGMVLLPLLGFRQVSGRSFGAVRLDILSDYQSQLIDPVIRATPLVRIAVLGEVQRPGLFRVDPTLTLGDVLATAGGMLPTADRGNIALVREGEVVAAELDPRSTTLDLTIRSGDQVIAGRRSWLSENLPIFISAITGVAAAAVTSFIVSR